MHDEDRPSHNCTWNECHHFFTTLYQTASSSMGDTNFAVNNHRFTDLRDLIVKHLFRLTPQDYLC